MTAYQSAPRWMRFAVQAGAALFVLALFVRLKPRQKLWGQFVVGGMLAVCYLVLIVFATGPQFVGILREVFRV